jgi:hypothetical protein
MRTNGGLKMSKQYLTPEPSICSKCSEKLVVAEGVAHCPRFLAGENFHDHDIVLVERIKDEEFNLSSFGIIDNDLD